MNYDNDDDSELQEGKVLSFLDHLQELRVRIIICIAWFVVCFLGSFFVAPQTVSFLMQPLITLPRSHDHGILTLYLAKSGEVTGWAVMPPSADLSEMPTTITAEARLRTEATPTTALANLARDSIRIIIDGVPQPIEIGPKTQAHLTYLTPLEPFFVWMQGALLLSLVLTIPMIVWQFWLFISPGLLRSERGLCGPLLGAAILLFPMGAGLAYAVSKTILQALLAFGDQIPFLEPNLVASRYISFILVMMLLFGLVFEFPLVLVLLARLGFVNAELLTRQRRIAIVLMAVTAAVATPSPDPFSMLIMLAPLLVLYEASIWAIRLMERKARTTDA